MENSRKLFRSNIASISNMLYAIQIALSQADEGDYQFSLGKKELLELLEAAKISKNEAVADRYQVLCLANEFPAPKSMIESIGHVFSVLENLENKNSSLMGSIFSSKPDELPSKFDGQNIKRDASGKPILYRGQAQLIDKVSAKNSKLIPKVSSQNSKFDGQNIKRDANGKPLLYRGQVQPI
ncbi:MAG: hypothetical protein ACJAS1_000548 [Oleiphilaceae bacterium]|jgi:hypothetical protein